MENQHAINGSINSYVKETPPSVHGSVYHLTTVSMPKFSQNLLASATGKPWNFMYRHGGSPIAGS